MIQQQAQTVATFEKLERGKINLSNRELEKEMVNVW